MQYTIDEIREIVAALAPGMELTVFICSAPMPGVTPTRTVI